MFDRKRLTEHGDLGASRLAAPRHQRTAEVLSEYFTCLTS